MYVARKSGSSDMMTMPFSMSLIAKAPYPPLGDSRTSKNSVTKRGGASEEVKEEEEEEVEEGDGVRVRGCDDVAEFRPQRGADFGEDGGVMISWRWNERLDGRGWGRWLAAPLMPR